MPANMQTLYHKHVKVNAKEFLLLMKYARENDITYEMVIQASKILKDRGMKKYTVDQIKVALYTLKTNDAPSRDNQKTDEFIEIETGSEDILAQLDNVVENGTKK